MTPVMFSCASWEYYRQAFLARLTTNGLTNIICPPSLTQIYRDRAKFTLCKSITAYAWVDIDDDNRSAAITSSGN